MFRRIIAVLVALSLIIVPTVAFAESPLDGRVYSIEKDEKAPYAGILLDGIAASKMITDKKYLRTEHLNHWPQRYISRCCHCKPYSA